jgi:uncharacterized protein (TIGR03437 family)
MVLRRIRGKLRAERIPRTSPPPVTTGAASCSPGNDPPVGPGSGDAGTWTAIQISATVSAGPPLPIVNLNGVVNGASLQAGIAPNSWITILGSNLSQQTDYWTSAIIDSNLPTVLDGVSVTIGGQAAYIAYVSPTQINALAPNIGPGDVGVVVSSLAGTSSPVFTICLPVQPAFFQWGTYAVATHLNFTQAAKDLTPAKPGETIILWGTGFGPTSPALPVGVEVPFNLIYRTANAVTVTVGGIPATVYGAALSPGYAGLYQVAIQVPPTLTSGDYPVIATISGTKSPSSTLLTVQGPRHEIP